MRGLTLCLEDDVVVTAVLDRILDRAEALRSRAACEGTARWMRKVEAAQELEWAASLLLGGVREDSHG